MSEEASPPQSLRPHQGELEVQSERMEKRDSRLHSVLSLLEKSADGLTACGDSFYSHTMNI